MFVIVRDDGAYVAPRGSEHSYTWDLAKAQTYATRKAAEEDRCPDNERVVAVADLMQKPKE